jgi:hypothetical protein
MPDFDTLLDRRNTASEKWDRYGDIASPRVLGSFALLGLFALIPEVKSRKKLGFYWTYPCFLWQSWHFSGINAQVMLNTLWSHLIDA